MILDEINKANVQSIKDKDMVARSIYSVIKNKAMLEVIKKRENGEELNDVDMVAILQKTIKELDEEAENYVKAGNLEEKEKIEKQKSLLAIFMPQMLSEQEIKDIISTLDDKSVPFVMKHFKANYAGKCDMKLVSIVLKGM